MVASDPKSATYCPDNDKVFWFIVASDTHIGMKGSEDRDNLRWLITEARNAINPQFIVVAGDLTDSTYGNALGIPDGPHKEEWEEYRQVLEANGIDATFYYDIAGNHDAYNDKNLSYYLNYSIQGKATGQTQISWTRNFAYGKYYFLGVCTAGNDGAGFSVDPLDNFGDHAGLDAGELEFIKAELEVNKDANLSLIFGHHPLERKKWPPSSWPETALTYGDGEFIGIMNLYKVLSYTYGHTHTYIEEFFSKPETDGVIYLNVASLAKSSENQYSIVAIDCNGISITPENVGVWPAVLITAPLDKNLGIESNPYTSNISHSGLGPIRALVFDKNPVTRVEYRIDSKGDWYPMTRVDSNPYLWEAESVVPLWDGSHSVEVKATGSSTRTDRVPTSSPGGDVGSDGGGGCFIDTAAHGSP